MIAVNPLMDSLWIFLSKGLKGETRTGGLFRHEYFKVFPKSSKKSSSKYGRSGGWKPSSESSCSGEGLWVGGVGSASVKETSSWLNIGSTWRVLREECSLECGLEELLSLWFCG